MARTTNLSEGRVGTGDEGEITDGLAVGHLGVLISDERTAIWCLHCIGLALGEACHELSVARPHRGWTANYVP